PRSMAHVPRGGRRSPPADLAQPFARPGGQVNGIALPAGAVPAVRGDAPRPLLAAPRGEATGIFLPASSAAQVPAEMLQRERRLLALAAGPLGDNVRALARVRRAHRCVEPRGSPPPAHGGPRNLANIAS